MLSIIGTPIGNLSDLSLRQAQTILSCDILLAEDTRKAEIILTASEQMLGASRSDQLVLVSYYKEKELEKLPFILESLRDGKQVGLVTDAGMPTISDPGSLLISHCRQEELPYTVIPGPSSITTALALSGVNAHSWTFVGFLPKKENDVKRAIKQMVDTGKLWKKHAFVLFESPERCNETLRIFAEVAPTCKIAVCREMTKKFEEVLSGTPAELMQKELRGEVVLVLQF